MHNLTVIIYLIRSLCGGEEMVKSNSPPIHTINTLLTETQEKAFSSQMLEKF